ncbi:uncharacterized protein N7477_008347 [Penicillium maclennaniae]|uniref:uncharacterized protein n=1 Tax=Penicillium maclennaniae TaxID=1343394 RepID=UPI00253FA95D|nr:uncharacterized protein N7477_008347 [Penicillium maclennaniae]KAJ5665899.1 hypothetical protein N7477_008347 [Penicillium maclennaniae]
MPQKTIFLMGAPLPGHLDWDNDELFDKPIPPFQGSSNTEEGQPITIQRPVKWRVLQPLDHEQPNVYQSFYYGPDDPNFLTTHQLETMEDSSTPEDGSLLSKFYDHSFALHEARYLRVIFARANTGRPEQFGGSSSAKHLQSITPQTKTINLVVGIIAVHPPRRIVTRQWKKALDLIELEVGDETQTGFGVNFWLPAEKPAKTQEIDRLGPTLAALRPRDIVLLRTVGLSTFQDRVYGQSLRGMTKINLLNRWPADATDAGGHRGQRGDREKLNRVREWALRFVGTDAAGSMSGMPETQRGPLPPDTQ